MDETKKENKMLENAELDGSLGQYGNYAIDYADGKVVASVNLAHDFGHVDAKFTTEVSLDARDVVMAWVKSTDTELDDAFAKLLFDKLKL